MAQARNLVPADDMPDNLVPASDMPDNLLNGADFAPADMTKMAQPRPEGFMEHLFAEGGQGLSSIGSGLSRAMEVDPYSPNNQPLGLGEAALGAMQLFFAPVAATGHKIGEVAQDVSMAMGAGPNVSAAIATAADMGTQMVGIPKAMSAAAPYVMKGIQGAASHLPGAQVTLREMGKKIVEAFPSALKPKVSSDVLYNMVDQMNPEVTLPRLHKTAREVLKTEAALKEVGLANEGLASTSSKMVQATSKTIDPAVKWLGDEFGVQLQTAPKEMPFSLVQDIRQRIGKRIGQLRASGNAEELGSYKQLYKSLSKDLEDVANTEGSAAFKILKKANESANREFAIGELDDVFNATMGRALEGQEFTSSNFAKALNKIRDMRRDNELFRKGIGDANLDKIESTLDELRKLKINPPPKAVNVGAGLVAARTGVMGGIGASLGALMGGPTGGAIGAGIGSTMGAGVPWAISRIMQSPKASSALVKVLKKDGAVSPRTLQALIAISAVQDTNTRNFIDDFQTMMKDAGISVDEKVNAAMQRSRIQNLEKTAMEQLSE